MIVRIELAIVVDEKMKVIKSDYIKGEIETIEELANAVEAYRKDFLTKNPHIKCQIFASAKLTISV